MGYEVYEDAVAEQMGVQRHAGYGVPGVCDFPSCNARLRRGLDEKCVEIYTYMYVDADGVETYEDSAGEELEVAEGGCGLFFCGAHMQEHPESGLTPKPDLPEWELYLIQDASWAEWRKANPARVADIIRRLWGFQ